MIIAVGSDHAGYELKQSVIAHLEKAGHKVSDMGTNGPQSVDYPDYSAATAQQVASGKADRGVVICGTGIGVSMAANKVHGIRAALCTSAEMGTLATEHNNANVLALGARILSVPDAMATLDAWLAARFQGGRHQSRIDKIMALEK